jgi:choline dehydrogenase-like flavoprotein
LTAYTLPRLANLDHNLKVLLIEAGENNLNNPWVFRPGIFPRNMKLDSKTASFYESRPSKWLNGRGAIVPAAHILGGGSSINFMVGDKNWLLVGNSLADDGLDVHPRLGLRL